MDRREFLLYSSVGLISLTTNLEQLLENTPNVNKMHAKKVVDSENVINSQNALSEPNKKYAEILPHGNLTLKMERPFSPLVFDNSGHVIAKPGVNYSLAALIPVDDTYPWREIIPGVVPNSFKIPKDDLTIVDTIKIKNIDKRSLYIDAVVGY